MAGDAELDHFRDTIDCRAVLTRAGWKLDAAESTEAAAKFRRGEGEIIVVTHGGKGWFDPLSSGAGLNEERGDVIALDQRLHGGSLGHVRKRLRMMSGLAAHFVRDDTQEPRQKALQVPATRSEEPSLRWNAAKAPQPGSPGWQYLVEQRGIPAGAVQLAVRSDALREGIYGTIWGAHRDAEGVVCGWEMRGPSFKGFSKGGDKAIFTLGDPAKAERLLVVEAMIDAMSLMALDDPQQRAGSAYLSTGGGFGPHTEAALRERLRRPGVELIAATDRGIGGDRLAERLSRLAAEAGAKFSRRLPPSAADWNDELRQMKRPVPATAPQPTLL